MAGNENVVVAAPAALLLNVAEVLLFHLNHRFPLVESPKIYSELGVDGKFTQNPKHKPFEGGLLTAVNETLSSTPSNSNAFSKIELVKASNAAVSNVSPTNPISSSALSC